MKLLLLSIVIFCVCQSAIGQTPSSDTLKTYLIHPVTITATRTLSPVSDVPASVDVVTSRELEKQNTQTLSQAIEHQSGVFLNDLGNIGDIKTVSLRGSTTSQVLVLLDGQRLNTAQEGVFNLSALPLEGIERIEILKGGTSALYGADAVGGVVNIITQSATRHLGLGFDGKLLSGSFDTRGAELNTRYSTGQVASFFSYKYLATNGDFAYDSLGIERTRLNADANSHGLFGKAIATLGDPADNRTVSLTGQYVFSKSGDPGTIVYPLASSRKTNRNGSLSLAYSQNVGSPYHHVQWQSYFHNFEFTYDDPFLPNYSHNVAAGSEIQWRSIFSNWNTLTAGYEFRTDYFTGTPLVSNKRRNLNSVYVQDELIPFRSNDGFVRKIVAIPAVRWDRFSDFGGQISPKVGVLVSTMVDTWQTSIKGNYGRSFRAPSFNDLYWPNDGYTAGNPNLSPETGTDFDAGIMVRNATLIGLAIDLTYFNNRMRDLIQWQPDASGLWMPSNVGMATIRGMETKLAVSPFGDLLRLEWNYTFLDARNKSDLPTEADKFLTFRPQHVNNLSATLDLGETFVQATSSFVSRRYTAADNRTSLPAYRVTNALVSRSLSMGLSSVDLIFEVRNLEGTKYQVIDGFPMPGREIRVSLAMKYASEK